MPRIDAVDTGRCGIEDAPWCVLAQTDNPVRSQRTARSPAASLPSLERVVPEISQEHDDRLVTAVGVLLSDFNEPLSLMECQ